MAKNQTSIPIYEGTLERIQAVKRDRTYDELVNEWIDEHESDL